MCMYNAGTVHAKDALCLWALSILTTRHSITDTVTTNDNVRVRKTPLYILENSSQSMHHLSPTLLMACCFQFQIWEIQKTTHPII